MVALEMAKIDIEAMHSLLRRFETNPLKNNDIVMLDDIQAEFVKLLQKLKDAEELRKERRNEMIQKLETDINALIKSVTNTTAQINTGKLIQEDTPPNEALQALNEVKIRNLDKYKERDRNYTNYGKLMGLT
jgi:dynein heavy chain